MIAYSRPKRSDLYTYARVNCLKTIPFTAAHTYIAHIWQYPPGNSLSMLAFSSIHYSLVLKHRGQILVEMTGKRRNKGIGIEIPVTYSIYHKKPRK